MTKLIKYITILLATIAVMSSCWGEDDENHSADPVFKAIPPDASFIFVANDLVSLAQKIQSDNPLWNDLKSIKQIQSADKIISDISDILAKEDKLRADIRSKKCAISFHNNGHKINAIIAMLVGKQAAQTIINTIQKITQENDTKIQFSTHEEVKIGSIPLKRKQDILYFAYYKGFMLFSYSDIHIQNAIRQLKNDNNIADLKPLNQIIALKGNDVDVNIIINYERFYEIIGPQFNSAKRSVTKRVSKFADWSVLDISAQEHSATLSGYSSAIEKSGAFINIFNGQSPVSNSFEEYIPGKTIQFASIGISDMVVFKNNYKTYLNASNKKSDYDQIDNTNRKQYKVNLEENIYQIIYKRITEFTTDYSIAVRANDNYIIAETDDEDLAKKTILQIVNQYKQKNNKKDNEIAYTIVSQNKNKIPAYFFPIKNLFATYFGEIFGTMDYSYVAFYDSKLIFTQNLNAIKEYVNAIESGKTLDNNSYYKEFKKFTNSESNIFYYTDLTYNKNSIAEILNNENKNEYLKNFGKLKNFRSAAIQVSKTNNKFYTYSVVNYSDVIEAERLIKWKTPLDSTAIIKPQIVRNFETGENNILIQDDSKKIYLINKDGKKLWKKQLPEDIVGQIYQIDYYRNGKIQYLFATETSLHCIDKNGNYVENYPIEIKEGISSEISVYDYENDGNYRIFIPCNNKKLYLYTKEGTPLDTWTPVETKEKIITQVQYLKYNDNEYLVFADNLKTYILNRRGEPRIVPTRNFPKAPKTRFYIEASGNVYNVRFVTTNSAGEIEYINMDGSSETKKIKSYSINHNFVMEDINGDGLCEYIFTDNNCLEIFNHKYEKIGDCFFDGDVSGKPIIFKFGNNSTKIGITCKDSDKAYLLNNKAQIQKDFPINGITEFSITKFGNADNFNLIIGGKDNYLYNYTIQ